jgi:hypothetical protein
VEVFRVGFDDEDEEEKELKNIFKEFQMRYI